MGGGSSMGVLTVRGVIVVSNQRCGKTGEDSGNKKHTSCPIVPCNGFTIAGFQSQPLTLGSSLKPCTPEHIRRILPPTQKSNVA
jgi:hypothetical protein